MGYTYIYDVTMVNERKKNILELFIEEKMKSYVEPQRAGTAKGDRIGFSSTKYLMTLFALAFGTKKEMAERSGVSYALLRKWHGEKEFKKTIERHRKEFTELFVSQVRSLAVDAKKITDEFYSRPVDEIINLQKPVPDYSGLGTGYAQETLDALEDALGSLISEAGEKQDISLLFTVLDVSEILETCFLRYQGGLDLEVAASEAHLNVSRGIDNKAFIYGRLAIVRAAKEALIHPDRFNEEDKKRIILGLSSFERYFERRIGAEEERNEDEETE
ncbi:MAG: hypothetical protein A4E57_00004 [Syntrophorhabdaceae bacterium PtaU1.Bin034]|nr:MAG: hypothetical protein A4E57_00004 [Syntrophorhabdaceae bacterium PtaU1.Bin034]